MLTLNKLLYSVLKIEYIIGYNRWNKLHHRSSMDLNNCTLSEELRQKQNIPLS